MAQVGRMRSSGWWGGAIRTASGHGQWRWQRLEAHGGHARGVVGTRVSHAAARKKKAAALQGDGSLKTVMLKPYTPSR